MGFRKKDEKIETPETTGLSFFTILTFFSCRQLWQLYNIELWASSRTRVTSGKSQQQELVRSKVRRWLIRPGSDKKNCWSPAQWPAWTSATASFSRRPQCGFPPRSLLRLQRTFPPPLPRTSLQYLCSPRSHFCSPHFQSSEVKPESGISECHRCYWENMASSLKLLKVSLIQEILG